MIIVSQDKVAIINHENIEAIYLLERNGKLEINVRGIYDYTIGIYETKERAKEVLVEMAQTYMDCNAWSLYGVGIMNKVYEMPQE